MDVKNAIASGNNDLRAHGLDHAVAHQNCGLFNGVTRCDEHLRPDERKTRGIARAHAVRRRLLGVGGGTDGEREERRNANRGHGANRTRFRTHLVRRGPSGNQDCARVK